ncbi:putative integral membrane protein [Handroanthus impetiginosus]|uniref:Putative integral membrane protein n=1 Tax=Handroanthus impetiginosus TaxID=429701 RepID=A0A2G9HQB6_9LAMI|nr:putative integral membrane protein [Handroanthus impetiginosus]
MALLVRSAASSPQFRKTVANPSASTVLFHIQSNFHPRTPPRKLSTFKHLNIYHINGNCRLKLRHVPPFATNGNASQLPPPPPTPPPSDSHANNRKFAVVACSAATVALAIANRVLYKLALVPMKEFPFFLAQLTTFGYVAIYFSVLYMRYRAGIATDEMLAYPKSRFIIIGLLEALGVVSGMYSGAMLPGPAIPILNQTFLVWQLAFSVLLLGRTYSLNRLAGCFLVAAGVALAVTSGAEHDQMLSGVAIVWPAMMMASTAFQAVASVVKESVFIDAATRLKGKLLDLFVVNSFGSGFQALFVLLFLPLLSNIKGIPFSELPSYLRSGAACFFNVGTNTTGCDGAPLLPLLYITTNIAFNISVLNLLKFSSAVVSSLAVVSSVPISIYILSLPLPYLPEGVSLSPYFILGSVVLMMGLVVYNLSWSIKQDSDIL